MAYATFKDCEIDGTNVVQQWLQGQGGGVRGSFVALLSLLENLAIRRWRDQAGYQALRGRYRGLHEFKVSFAPRPGRRKLRYRLGACRGTARGTYIFLAGWIHDTDAPMKEGMELALERRRLIVTGEAKVVAHVE
ncbi:MAG: hypothetical protein WEE64_13560 [Dehalococcoidia bacterium]